MQSTSTSNWALDLVIRCKLSIREARLRTSQKVVVIAGQNGCGKSQLFRIIHSYCNSSKDSFLKNSGDRNYFLREQVEVGIRGPSRVFYTHPARVIGRHPKEIEAGPYSFADLARSFDIKDRYNRFRWCVSKLAYEARHYAGNSERRTALVRRARLDLLDSLVLSFESLFPGRTLSVDVSDDEQRVFVFARRADMPFVRPQDPTFKDIIVPFSSLSDGEMNCLFLIFEMLWHSQPKRTRLLFMVDEIENHMHPALQVQFLQTLLARLPANVILLATTHSPHVLTAVPRESRYLMVHSSDKDASGKLYANQLLNARSETTVARMLYDLYGAESRATAACLLEDIRATAQGEWIRYAASCLREGSVRCSAKPTDPQRVFASALFHRGLESLEVLDIGAGEGRLIKAIGEDTSGPNARVYHFDLIESKYERRVRLQGLATLLPNHVVVRKVCSRLAELEGEPQYDLIFLHNVLHELSYSETINIFASVGHLLRTGGAVNIMEQLVLPEGERAYFVMSGAAMTLLLRAMGFVVDQCHHKSFSGVPLYELTGTKTDAFVCPTPEEVTEYVGDAIRGTLGENLEVYQAAGEDVDNPAYAAFLAFNIANGQLRLRLSHAEEGIERGHGVDGGRS